MANDLDAKFWRACDILRRDDNTQGLLDYVEQISWLLFLKAFEDLEDNRIDEAAYKEETYERVIDGYYRWSVWTGGRIERARTYKREADSALRAALKQYAEMETADTPDEHALIEARSLLMEIESTIERAQKHIASEQAAQRAALEPLLESEQEDDRKMAQSIIAGLTGKPLLHFLEDYLFEHLRSLTGTLERDTVRQLFEETPSKMVKDGVNLRDAIEVIDQIDFHAAETVHTLSHLYESLLAKLGRESGMSGELYTPRGMIRFIVQMIDPRIGEDVYDPATGSAGFHVEAYQYMEAQATLPSEYRILQTETFYGQEKKPLGYLLGVMNAILHGISVPHFTRKNTLSDDIRNIPERNKHKVTLTNPPFGGTENVAAIRGNFPYESSKTSILFLQHIMALCARDGRVGMVIDEGVLFTVSDSAYVNTKKDLLEQFNLYAIVSLPVGVFANAVSSGTGPKTDILFFNHLGPTQQVWFYEVRAVGFSLTRTQKPIPENDLPDCLAMFRAYDAWRRSPVALRSSEPPLNERCWIVPAEVLASERNYDLSARNPNPAQDLTHRPPEEIAADLADKQARVAELVAEIQDLLAEGNEGE